MWDRYFKDGPRIEYLRGDMEGDFYECLECGATLTNNDVEIHWCAESQGFFGGSKND